MNLSIIIPLYNEENTIAEVLSKVMQLQLPAYVQDSEIIIVDDCSDDNSLQIAESFCESNNKIHVYNHRINRGKGAAVKTGIQHARGDVYLIQDADTELSPADIPKLICAMHELQIQFVNGSRFLPGVVRPLFSFKRYLANRVFTFLTSLLINVKLTDMACGYKLIAKDLYDKIDLKENRFGFEAELIIKAMRIKKNNVAEVAVQYFPRNEGEGKKLKMMDGFRILWTIIKYAVFNIASKTA